MQLRDHLLLLSKSVVLIIQNGSDYWVWFLGIIHLIIQAVLIIQNTSDHLR